MAKKSAGGAPGLIALVVGVAVAYYAVTWPYQLGTWIAVEMGAGLPSTQRSVLGWVFEVLYLVVLALLGGRWLWVRHRRTAGPPPFDEGTADLVLAMIDGAVPRSDVRVPGSEKVRLVLDGVRLVEPRGRAGAKVPTAVGQGTLFVTDKAARFVGSDGRARVWKWASVTQVVRGADHVRIDVATRALECGVAFPRGAEVAGATAVLWATRAAQGASADELGQIAEGLRETARSVERQAAAQPAAPRPLSQRARLTAVAAVAATALVSTGAVAVAIRASPAAGPVIEADAVTRSDLLDAPEVGLVEVDPEVVAASDAVTADPADLVRFDDAVAGAGAETALATLGTLEVKGRAPKTGYDREQFGPAWADTDRNGCDTRNDLLRRDLTGETFKPGTQDCVVLTGTLADPYTATTIAFQRGSATSSAVQIDHVVALSDAWQKGAQQLDAETRKRFANDPLNLLAVDGPANQAKGAGDAATWLPPNRAYRCEYVARQVAVKAAYGLWVTQAERDVIARVLSDCPGQLLPTGDGAYAAQAALEPAGDPVVPVVPVPVPAPAPDPVVVLPDPAPVVVPDPVPAPPTPAPAPEPEPAPVDVYYQNCDAVRAAGAAPIVVGDPGFQRKFDRDGDGVGCE